MDTSLLEINVAFHNLINGKDLENSLKIIAGLESQLPENVGGGAEYETTTTEITRLGTDEKISDYSTIHQERIGHFKVWKHAMEEGSPLRNIKFRAYSMGIFEGKRYSLSYDTTDLSSFCLREYEHHPWLSLSLPLYEFRFTLWKTTGRILYQQGGGWYLPKSRYGYSWEYVNIP